MGDHAARILDDLGIAVLKAERCRKQLGQARIEYTKGWCFTSLSKENTDCSHVLAVDLLEIGVGLVGFFHDVGHDLCGWFDLFDQP